MKNDQPAYKYIEDILRQRIKAAVLKPRDAATADDAIARALGLSRGSPVLHIRQVIHSKADSATIYVVGFYRSEFHTLLVRRHR
jgi:DNA-binding GntR family transcriptional regulator